MVFTVLGAVDLIGKRIRALIDCFPIFGFCIPIRIPPRVSLQSVTNIRSNLSLSSFNCWSPRSCAQNIPTCLIIRGGFPNSCFALPAASLIWRAKTKWAVCI